MVQAAAAEQQDSGPLLETQVCVQCGSAACHMYMLVHLAHPDCQQLLLLMCQSCGWDVVPAFNVFIITASMKMKRLLKASEACIW